MKQDCWDQMISEETRKDPTCQQQEAPEDDIGLCGELSRSCLTLAQEIPRP